MSRVWQWFNKRMRHEPFMDFVPTCACGWRGVATPDEYDARDQWHEHLRAS